MNRVVWQVLGILGVLVFIGWSSSGADLKRVTLPFPQTDRAEALRTCKLALSEAYRVISTYDVHAAEVEEHPGITRVSGGVLLRDGTGAAEPHQYRCDYNTFDGKVVSFELLPLGSATAEASL